MPENTASDILLDAERLRRAQNNELFPLLQARVADSVEAAAKLEQRLEAERLLAARVRQLITELAAINRTPLPQADRMIQDLRNYLSSLFRDLEDPQKNNSPFRPSWQKSWHRQKDLLASLEKAVAEYTATQNVAVLRQALMDIFAERCQACGLMSQANSAEERPAAIEHLTSSLELDPGLSVAWYQRGLLLLQDKKYRQAADDLSRAVDLNPELSPGWRHLGTAWRFLGEYDKALLCFEKSLRLDPRSSAAYTGRGIIHSLLEHKEEAFSDFNRAIELDPLNPQAYNNRANELMDRGQHDRALEDYNQALKINPRYVQALNNRGSLYRELKEYDRALNDFARALEVDPEHTYAFINRGNVYADLKQYDLALADYTRAIELDPNNSRARNNRGILYAEMGRRQEALADFDQALALDPKHASAYSQRALVQADLGRPDLAIADYQQAISLQPENSANHLNLAELYLVGQRYQEMLACLQRADPYLKDDGDRLVYYYLSSLAQRLLGLDTKDSDLAFERMLPRVSYVGWSFDAIDGWLSQVSLPEEKRQEIMKFTQQLKTKTKI